MYSTDKSNFDLNGTAAAQWQGTQAAPQSPFSEVHSAIKSLEEVASLTAKLAEELVGPELAAGSKGQVSEVRSGHLGGLFVAAERIRALSSGIASDLDRINRSL